MALTAFSSTFAYLYKRGQNFSMLFHTDLKQKELYTIQNSDSFKLCCKAHTVQELWPPQESLHKQD